MEVKIICGAQYAYAAITDDGVALDVKLNGGRSPTTSLIETARDMRQKAVKLLRRASLIEQAAAHLS